MDAFKIAIKLLATADGFGHGEFIPVFHRWIQNQSVPGHLLIDVSDYSHVAEGPSALLVAAEANFVMDRGNGELGLVYSRKKPAPGPFRRRLTQAIAQTVAGASLLTADSALAGRLSLRTDEFIVRINDRLLAPNNAATFNAVKPDIEAVARLIYGAAAVSIEQSGDPQSVFEVRIKSAAKPTLDAIRDQLM
jgi:hypothetical protein